MRKLWLSSCSSRQAPYEKTHNHFMLQFSVALESKLFRTVPMITDLYETNNYVMTLSLMDHLFYEKTHKKSC